ncbi:(S)-ureidoglycine aminohydrolase-like isoform X2 [Amaranthus tricolor]|uniref:(S)-ureidoglycine aminohydrolase-like isoform X2 n=1 Tax=Amaranthus tricolor TaxID=29722 RepID=UPI002589208C|nr:(S)-ureidoglycine aminohydrolase-like isoform X2 [Amaranthus tricolor]
MGSHFVMYTAKIQDNSRSALPPGDVERLVFVVDGGVSLTNGSDTRHNLMVDSYAYLPPNFQHSIDSAVSATLVVFERRFMVKFLCSPE